MANFSRRELSSRRIEFALPVPSVGAELHKTLDVAEQEYRNVHGLMRGIPLPDDALTVTVSDDEVVISFTVGESES